MRLIIEARLEGDPESLEDTEAAKIVAVLDRQDGSLAHLGLTLAEGRALLAEVQSVLVVQQTSDWMADKLACCRCGTRLAHKDSRSIVTRTLFGKVEIPGLRLAKKQQMRWTDEGAYCLAQVRVAVLKGEFTAKGLAGLAKMACANSPHLRTAA